MMFKFIMNSLLLEAKIKVNIWSEEYSIVTYKSGNLLLKVVTRYFHLDTNVKTSQISIQLSTLDDFMATCGHVIPRFNGNVKVLLDSLKERLEMKNDLLTNLFKGYAAFRNKLFVKYTTRKQGGYEEGIYILPDNLIHLYVQKFKIPKTTNKWNAPSDS